MRRYPSIGDLGTVNGCTVSCYRIFADRVLDLDSVFVLLKAAEFECPVCLGCHNDMVYLDSVSVKSDRYACGSLIILVGLACRCS